MYLFTENRNTEFNIFIQAPIKKKTEKPKEKSSNRAV
jgi:hypothetical protein